MPQVPFTPAGVQQKLAELYALSDHDLEFQAKDLEAHFLTWVAANFTLSTEQSNYLSSLTATFLQITANEIATTLKSRLPLILDPLPLVPKKSSKVFEIHRTLTATCSNDLDKSAHPDTLVSDLHLKFYYVS